MSTPETREAIADELERLADEFTQRRDQRAAKGDDDHDSSEDDCEDAGDCHLVAAVATWTRATSLLRHRVTELRAPSSEDTPAPPVTVIAEHHEAAPPFTEGWSWSCANRACGTVSNGHASHADAFNDPKRLAHTCTPADTPEPRPAAVKPATWPAPGDRVAWTLTHGAVPAGAPGTVSAVGDRSTEVEWDQGDKHWVYTRHLRPLTAFDDPAPAPRVWREGEVIPADVGVVYGKRGPLFRQIAAQNRGPDEWTSASTGVISEQRLLSEHGPVSEVPAGGGA